MLSRTGLSPLTLIQADQALQFRTAELHRALARNYQRERRPVLHASSRPDRRDCSNTDWQFRADIRPACNSGWHGIENDGRP